MSAAVVEPTWAMEPDWGDDPFAGLVTPVGWLRAVDADAAAEAAHQAFLAGASQAVRDAAVVDAAVERVARCERMRRSLAAEQAVAVAELTALTRDPRVVVARSGLGFSAHEECVVTTGVALGLSTWWAGRRVDEALHWTQQVPLALEALDAGLLGEGGVRAILEETADLDPDDVEAVTRVVLDRAGHGAIDGVDGGDAANGVDDVPLGQREPVAWQMLDPDVLAQVVAKATTAAVRRWAKRAALQLRDARATAAGLDPAGETARVDEQRRAQARQARTVEVSPGKEGMAWLSIYAPEADILAAAQTVETDARQVLSQQGSDEGDPMLAQQVMADLAIDRLLGRPSRYSGAPECGTTGSAATAAGATGSADPGGTAAPGAPQCSPPAGLLPTGTGHPGAWSRPVQLTVIIDGEAVAHAGRLGPIERASLHDLITLARGAPGGRVTVQTTDRLECRGHPPGSPQGPYEVPDPLARAIKARDVTCRFPGCTIAATGCDLDHTNPYQTGGPTCACNLAALCRHHHRLKTHANGWTLRQLGDGILEWTDPSGKTYRTRPG